MIPLMFAALGGGLATASVVAPLGALTAVIATPFGAGLGTLLAAFYIARQRGSEWQDSADLDEQTDAMVAALRGLAAEAKRVSDLDAGSSRETDTVRAA